MASTNIFDVLNDDAPDQEIRVPPATAKKPASKPVASVSSGSANKSAVGAPRKDGATRANNSGNNTNRTRDNEAPRGPQYDRAPRDSEATPRLPRGSRAPRGARGGRHGGYDRHSGTGIIDSEKKENNRLGDPTSAFFDGEKDAALSAEEPAAIATSEPTEPEEVIKTLDDYLQEKASKSLKIALPEARAANAGSDDSKWKDAKVLEVEETGDFIKMGKDPVAKSRKGKKETKVLFTDIDIRFSEPARDPVPRSAFRGGRGGAGERGAPRGARGGAGRGSSNHGARPGSRGGASVNVDDQELFPSLGSQ
ncbi:hypothetical protein EDD11_010546 [Mortierella claussenii]|nr:hypothetical protein EDD11_010546 [Mortierella claussenii]